MATLTSYNPATGEPVGEVTVTPVSEISDVVARARAAQPGWQALGHEGRAERLLGMREATTARADELAALLTREMGKPVREARGEIISCVKNLADELREIGEALAPEVLEDERTRSTIYRDPFGVCAAITPWNFPFSMPHWMVLPALTAGNTVVLKPSEETPLIGQAYADIVRGVVPDGVLQVVHGADDQGKALVESDVDMIAFTGSRDTGKKIMRAAAGELKRLVLELGGKDPLIVLDDADLAGAAKFAARNSFFNAGQVCVSTERIFVDRRVADRFVDLLVAETGKLAVGDGMTDGTRVGPMINGRQRDHVLRQLRDAVEHGARVVCGVVNPDADNQPGLYLSPTVVTDVRSDMAIAREETFGPVACVTAVESEDEAVAMANDTPFGLGAVVFGQTERAGRVARRLTAGMIGINASMGGARGTPWVGARQSGFGYHSSRDGHRQFTQTRVVSTPRG